MLSYWPFVGWKNIGFKSVHQCAPCITYVYFWWFLLLYYDNLKQKDRNLQISIPISVHLYALKSIFTSNSFQDIDWKVRKCKNISLGFVTHPDHCAVQEYTNTVFSVPYMAPQEILRPLLACFEKYSLMFCKRLETDLLHTISFQ